MPPLLALGARAWYEEEEEGEGEGSARASESTKGEREARDCSTELRKQVLPRLLSPATVTIRAPSRVLSPLAAAAALSSMLPPPPLRVAALAAVAGVATAGVGDGGGGSRARLLLGPNLV